MIFEPIYVYIDFDQPLCGYKMISNVFVFLIRFDSITYWIRIIQRFYIYDSFDENDTYIYVWRFRKPYMYRKGFFNEYVKDEFEDARSKIHPFLLRTVCELNSPYCDLVWITSSYIDVTSYLVCDLAIEYDLVSNMISY